MWEQSGNKTRQTPSKTGYKDIGKGKTNQLLTIWVLDLQAESHRFDPGHVHQHHSQIQAVANLAFARLPKLGSIWVQ
jgi:hypothetical protein